jgi:hypothetical protein
MIDEPIHSVDEIVDRLARLERGQAPTTTRSLTTRSLDQHRVLVGAIRGRLEAVTAERAALQREHSGGSAAQAGLSGVHAHERDAALAFEHELLTRELHALEPPPSVPQVFTVGAHVGSTSGWQVSDGRLTFHVTERFDGDRIVALLNLSIAALALEG